MNNRALILISHGQMAEGTLRSAELIIGKIEGACAISMDPRDAVERVKDKIKEAVDNFKNYDHLFVMVDLIGGTPCNAVLTELYKEKKAYVISGFNLAMVLEFATFREKDADKLKRHIIEIGKAQIKDLKMELKGVER
jgi:PTS system mannose-specific IIA component